MRETCKMMEIATMYRRKQGLNTHKEFREIKYTREHR